MVSPLSPRERRLIREMCAAYRHWAPPGERNPPALLRPLPGGFSNRSVLLAGERQHYVLRIGSRRSRPGVERWREARFLTRAAAAGVAAQPLYCDPRRGLLITAKLRCEPPGPDALPALARLLRRIHQLPCAGEPMNSARELDRYRERLDPKGACAMLLRRGADLLNAARERCRRSGLAPRSCHNDLLRANRCWTDAGYMALDWEYAAPGDPFFDLAVCASEMNADEGAALLLHYLGRKPRTDEGEHFVAQGLLYAALEACWWQCYGREADRREAALSRFAQRLEHGLRP